ncbi:phage holin family protein [Endozoicomonas lisbonensis]|uniref:Membrane protein n=1 Tax=Endozoicomonas lisbonensis TaxID=3120522 RepID=A0ABV2SEB3_9GAMM
MLSYLTVQTLYFAIYGLLIFFAGQLLKGVDVKSYGYAVLVALVLTLVNLLIRPVLIILTFPITVLTLGLFALILNSLLIYIVSLLMDGFYIRHFGWAIILSITLNIFKFIALLFVPALMLY